MAFLLTSLASACDLCNGPPRSVGDVDIGESVLELSLDSLESVVEVHSLVVLMLYDDRTAARERLQSFAMAAAALKELETGDELETGESVVLGVIDVASYAEVAHRLEARRMPCRMPHATRCMPHTARCARAAPNWRCLTASNLSRRHRLSRARAAGAAVRTACRALAAGRRGLRLRAPRDGAWQGSQRGGRGAGARERRDGRGLARR